MLNVFYSSEIKLLADKLLDERRQQSMSNPLAPEIFVVPNHGMGQWLSLYIAEEEGVAANLEFEFPSERIWKFIRTLHEKIPETLPSDRGPLTWRVFQLLQHEELRSDFEQLQYYLSDEDPVQQAIRTWKLSSKIADVFDQYLIYRPDLLLDWEKGDLQYFSRNEKWQAALWRSLLQSWKEKYPQKWLHRAQLQDDLLKAIDQGRLDRQKLPETMTIFGVSQMPPVFTSILVKLGDMIDVHFYQLSTTLSDGKQTKDAIPNSLLQQLGTQEIEFQKFFAASLEKYSHVSTSKEYLETKAPYPETKFQIFQDDLIHNRLTENVSNSPDDSIQVHSCHSRMREVEVLYNQLLNILDEHADVDPADILIVSPDMAEYAPLIEAVFGEPDEGQPSIPFHFSTYDITGNKLAIQTFLKVLDLCRSRFKMTEVLDVISSAPIREGYSFSDEDLNCLEKWIRDNRIRWGINGIFKSNMNVAKSDHYTWQAGLNRMLLGYAMRPDEPYLYDGIFPYDEVETSDDARLLGSFSHLLNILFAFQQRSDNRKTPAAWAEILLEISEELLPDIADYTREISKIRNTLGQLKEYADLVKFQQKVPYRLILNWVKNQLKDSSSEGGRWGQGITFAPMVPMQGIPFKMIGMIGMNEDAFPRSQIPIEFDLMEQESRPCDPVKREEDRYLFLKMLLSAKQYIYASYVGQSNHEDADFPPSVIIKNFINHVTKNYDIQEDSIVTKHFLLAHSPSYFLDDKIVNYSKNQERLSELLLKNSALPKTFLGHSLPRPDDERKTISIGQLISFFQHPAKYLMQQRLGIYLDETEALIEEREPFELRGLDSYEVGQRLINRYLKDERLEDYDEVLRSQDLLPEGWNGQAAYQKKIAQVRAFGDQLNKLLDQPLLEDYEVDLRLNDFRLRGKLSGLYEDYLLQYRFGKERPKDLIKLWIAHLVLQQCLPENHPSHSILATKNNDESWILTELMPIDDAEKRLKELLNMYWEGMQQCCYFFPKSSYAYVEELFTKDWSTVDNALAKAQKKWINKRRSYGNEGEDAYNQLVVGDEDPLSEQFQEVSARVWEPFFKALKNEDG